jgi:hypothetical protein
MVKSDTSKLVKSVENLIRKGYDLAIIVHSLRQVYVAKNIDNLLIQLATKQYTIDDFPCSCARDY